jgi:hypothetical protein
MRWWLPLLFVPSLAHARAASELPYSVADAFSTAVRFVRVDRGCKLVDKDADAAFVTFECKDEDKTKRGSLELWRSSGGVRVQVTLGDDPHYVELRWLELFERKLKDERGTPPPVARKPPPSPPDLGAAN